MSQLNDVIKTAIDNIQQIVDANTIIGKPINTENGTTLIPISKITVGIASGGVDYVTKKNSSYQNFGGGNGAGVSVSPVAFIVVAPNGDTKILNLSTTPDTIETINSVIAKTPDIIDKIKSVFPKKKKNKENNPCDE